MNTLKTQWKKALVLGALTLAPTLAATTQAQAAPYRPAPAPAWNNQHNNNNRYDNNRRNDNDRWDQTRNNNRYDNNRDDHRFDPRWNDNRRDDHRYDRDDHKDNNTAKIIGAGVVGAILGAVLSR